MKSISFLCLCFNLSILAAIVVSLLTCPTDLGAECSDVALDDWKGEFFLDIQKIMYEGPSSKNLLSYKWSNADEEILGKKMKATSTSLLATQVLKSLMQLCLHAFQCIPTNCEFPTAFQSTAFDSL